ncbi:hypothetical protein OUZ56_032663, partial [Daphnia magna]
MARAYSSARARSSPRNRWTTNEFPERRARTRSAVSTVLPASIGGARLARLCGDEFVEACVFPLALAEDAAEALDVLSDRSGAGHDHGDVRIRDVDPLVEDARGHDRAIAPVGEPAQDGDTLRGARPVGDHRREAALGNAISGRIVLGKKEHSIVRMFNEELIDKREFLRRSKRESALGTKRLEGAAALFGTRRFGEEPPPTVR